MADSVLLLCTILLTATFHCSTGQITFCNQGVAVENGNECKCSDPSKLYDYGQQDCVDEAVLYKFGDCGPNAAGTNCDCNHGWSRDESTGLCLQATSLCPETTCNSDEVCVDLPGKGYCRCNEDKYRSPSGDCGSVDETVNPQWADCPQGYQDETPSYSCFCAEPYFIDVDGNGRNCQINSTGGYEDCSTDVYVCASVDGTPVLTFARMGYDNATGEDIDECTSLTNTYCWAHSTCVNLKDGQGYLCQCDPGYTDKFFTTPLKECVSEEEPHCTGCQCDDVCSGVQCSEGLVCSTTSACSADCLPSLEESIISTPVEVSLYTGSVVVEAPQLDYYVNHLTFSLETIFGAQDVLVLTKDNDTFKFQISTVSSRLAGLGVNEVHAMLVEACHPLSTSGLCELPGGVVTANGSISLEVEPPCPKSSCPSAEYECTDLGNGRYQCHCKSGGLGNYMWNFIEDCRTCSPSSTGATTPTDLETTKPAAPTTPKPTSDCQQQVEDLQTELEESQHSQTVTAATLGTLLAVSLIALGVLVFFYMKK